MTPKGEEGDETAEHDEPNEAPKLAMAPFPPINELEIAKAHAFVEELVLRAGLVEREFARQSSALSGGIAPVIGFHSVIESPDPVEPCRAANRYHHEDECTISRTQPGTEEAHANCALSAPCPQVRWRNSTVPALTSLSMAGSARMSSSVIGGLAEPFLMPICTSSPVRQAHVPVRRMVRCWHPA